jgi:hypothetical protein
MKTVLFIATLVSLTVVTALAQGQSDRRVVYFSSDRPRLVTLSQVGTDVVSFAVPVGTTMAVSYAANTEPNLSAPRFEARRHSSPAPPGRRPTRAAAGGSHADSTVSYWRRQDRFSRCGTPVI